MENAVRACIQSSCRRYQPENSMERRRPFPHPVLCPVHGSYDVKPTRSPSMTPTTRSFKREAWRTSNGRRSRQRSASMKPSEHYVGSTHHASLDTGLHWIIDGLNTRYGYINSCRGYKRLKKTSANRPVSRQNPCASFWCRKCIPDHSLPQHWSSRDKPSLQLCCCFKDF